MGNITNLLHFIIYLAAFWIRGIFATRNRILGMIVSHDVHMSIDPLLLIFDQYLSMCEGGWSVSLIIYTAFPPSDRLYDYMSSKIFCYAINKPYKVRFEIADKSIGVRLALIHRKTVAAELENYDLFIYQEDDIIVTHAHVVAYIQEMKNLYIRNHSSPLNYTVGFQRYFIEDHPSQINEDYLIRRRERYQEFPHYQSTCYHGGVYMDCSRNTHQAMWMLSRSQIKILHRKCSFLDQTLDDNKGNSFLVREYMSSFSIFRNNFDFVENSCGMYKLMPLSTINRFFVHHYYMGKEQPDGKSIQDYIMGFNEEQNRNPACKLGTNKEEAKFIAASE